MSSDPFDSDDLSQSRPAPAVDDEDLFAFDEMSHSSARTKRTLTTELDQALSDVEHARDNVVHAAPRATTHAAPAGSVLPRSTHGPRHELTEPARVGRRLGVTSTAGALLAVFALANVLVSVLAWRSVADVRDLVANLGERVLATANELRAESQRQGAAVAEQLAPQRALDDGYATVERAREYIVRGDFERARRSLNGLLAVVDRFDAPQRADLEAQAGFVIAESYQRQALMAQVVGGAR